MRDEGGRGYCHCHSHEAGLGGGVSERVSECGCGLVRVQGHFARGGAATPQVQLHALVLE